MIGGYCILFRFKHSEFKTHSLAFQARGIRGPARQYFASGIYSINVSPRPTATATSTATQKANPIVVQRMLHELDNRNQKKELLGGDYEKLKKTIESL